MAMWLLLLPNEWRLYAWRAALHEPVRTLIHGRPWHDTQ